VLTCELILAENKQTNKQTKNKDFEQNPQPFAFKHLKKMDSKKNLKKKKQGKGLA
jgi:hypothetical protein